MMVISYVYTRLHETISQKILILRIMYVLTVSFCMGQQADVAHGLNAFRISEMFAHTLQYKRGRNAGTSRKVYEHTILLFPQ